MRYDSATISRRSRHPRALPRTAKGASAADGSRRYVDSRIADSTAGKVNNLRIRSWGDLFNSNDAHCWKVLRFLATEAKLLS